MSVGKLAPEIEGLDLDGKPMKLSDYRGKVVVLYLGRWIPSAALGAKMPPEQDFAPVLSRGFPALAKKMEGKPLALLAVLSGPDREVFRKIAQDSGPGARFWWDPDQGGKPGPIHGAWHAGQPNVFVIDPQATIRYTHLYQSDELKEAVERVLKRRE
jgi:hypothetical protein